MAWKTPVCLDSSCVALWQYLFDSALSRGAGVSQIRDNSQRCLLTHRPRLGVGVGARGGPAGIRFPPDPGIPPGLPQLCRLPHRRQWRGWGRPLALTTFPSHFLLWSSEHPVGSISNYPPHPSKPPPRQPFYLSSRHLLSAHSVPGTMPGIGRQGRKELDPCPKEITAL